MKTILYCFAVSASLLSLTSCKKEAISQSIVGKWKAVEKSDFGYGIDSTWKQVPQNYQTVFEFFSDGKFNETDPSGQNFSGTYELLNNNMIHFNFTGSSYSVDYNFSHSSNSDFIITYPGRDTYTKERYTQIN
jgi:hypothetical protein